MNELAIPLLIAIITIIVTNTTLLYLGKKESKRLGIEKMVLQALLEKADLKIKGGTQKIAELLKTNGDNIEEFNTQINQNNKSHREELQDNADKYDEALNTINVNASNQRGLFEEEIIELKEKLHAEQVDSNNKMYSRDKWKAKFETLSNIIKDQNNGNHIVKKYKSNWAKIIEAYNKAK